MALTMTRTRTQTALTKLAMFVANVHGELAFVEGLLAQAEEGSEGAKGDGCAGADALALLNARRQKLLADRDALYATVRRFDPKLDPETIGVGADWKLQFGRRGISTLTLKARYINQLQKGLTELGAWQLQS